MGRSPMMGSGYGGQEELAPVAGLCDGFHQSRAALAERVLGGRESHPQITDQRTIAVVRWRKGDLGRDCQASGAESPTGNRLHRQTGYDPRLVSEARRSEIRRLEETRIGRPPASRCGNCSADSSKFGRTNAAEKRLHKTLDTTPSTRRSPSCRSHCTPATLSTIQR